MTDIDSLLSRRGIALATLFLALLVVVRGAAALHWLRELAPRERVGLALFGATGLPSIVAIVGIGMDMDSGVITAQVGASLIGAGMLSVLVLPFVAIRIIGEGAAPGPRVSDEEY